LLTDRLKLTVELKSASAIMSLVNWF